MTQAQFNRRLKVIRQIALEPATLARVSEWVRIETPHASDHECGMRSVAAATLAYDRGAAEGRTVPTDDEIIEAIEAHKALWAIGR